MTGGWVRDEHRPGDVVAINNGKIGDDKRLDGAEPQPSEFMRGAR